MNAKLEGLLEGTRAAAELAKTLGERRGMTANDG